MTRPQTGEMAVDFDKIDPNNLFTLYFESGENIYNGENDPGLQTSKMFV